MATQVNPPPQLAIPKAFLADREIRTFVQQQNTILFQLWQRTGGNNDAVAEVTSSSVIYYDTYTQALQRQINGLPELTIDTSGFTTDTTLITTDKVIA